MKKFILAGLLALSAMAALPEAQGVPVYCDCKGIGMPNPDGGLINNNGTVRSTGGVKEGLTSDNTPIINLIIQLEMWGFFFRL